MVSLNVADQELMRSVVIDREVGLTFEDFVRVVAQRDAARAETIHEVIEWLTLSAKRMEEYAASMVVRGESDSKVLAPRVRAEAKTMRSLAKLLSQSPVESLIENASVVIDDPTKPGGYADPRDQEAWLAHRAP